jgi:cation:H+ antiporter
VTVVLLLVSFALIAVGALLFTNAVEWAGERLDLGQGAVGSILAAVGTALPESLIPVVAVLAGAEGENVAIGAIIGAPFMLGTVAMLLIASSAVVFRERRATGTEVDVERGAVRRDLGLFLPAFAVGLAIGLVDSTVLDVVGVIGLVAAYGFHVWQTLRASRGAEGGDELRPLRFDTTKGDPPSTFQIVAQLLAGLGAVIFGAELFVEEITHVAESVGIDALVLSLILAPLATELPEKMNSVIWMRRSKDTLAVGNVTGAMAFQATVPVALGLVITSWDLDKFAVAAGVLALLGGALALWRLERRSVGPASALAFSALFAALLVFVAVA